MWKKVSLTLSPHAVTVTFILIEMAAVAMIFFASPVFMVRSFFFVSSVWLFIRNHIINLVAKWLKPVWKFRTKKWRIHKCARWCSRQNSNSCDRFKVSHICVCKLSQNKRKHHTHGGLTVVFFINHNKHGRSNRSP